MDNKPKVQDTYMVVQIVLMGVVSISIPIVLVMAGWMWYTYVPAEQPLQIGLNIQNQSSTKV
jgi:hypothetical protein